MLAAPVHEYGDGPSVNVIQTSAEERETSAGEVLDRWSEIELAVEPGFDSVPARRDDIQEMTRLQRPHMVIYQCGDRFRASCGKEGQDDSRCESCARAEASDSLPGNPRASATRRRLACGVCFGTGHPDAARDRAQELGRDVVVSNASGRLTRGCQDRLIALANRTARTVLREDDGLCRVQLTVEVRLKQQQLAAIVGVARPRPCAAPFGPALAVHDRS